MELRGTLINIVRDVLTGAFNITLGVEEIPSGIDSLREKTLRISMSQWRNKRSLTANAYYWVLVEKITEAMNKESDEPFTQTEVHNILLRRYGQLEILDGKTVPIIIPDTDEADKKTLLSDTYHVRPTSLIKTGDDGVRYRIYRMLVGSSRYNSKEFSQLLDGAVAECKNLNVETLPPQEIERMMAKYEINHSDK